jgi:gamma-glutamyltranspeptidase/glutathione hydrolase
MTDGVVAAVEQLGAQAAASVLRLGGNAADAAIAGAFAQAVVNPIHATIAGSFHGLFLDSTTGRTQAVMSDGRAPLSCRDDMWEFDGRDGATWTVKGKRNRFGYEASMVPGFVRGAGDAFRLFGSGRVTWRQVVEPAIQLAAEGFIVYPYLYRLWMPNGFLDLDDGPAVMSQTRECARVFLHEDGSVYRIGERLVLEDYSRTLRRIADFGPDEFYEGETADRIVADFRDNGGTLTAEDLRRYQADIGEPVKSTFRDLEVYTEPVPSVGPITLEILNIIEGWDLAGLGWNSAPYLAQLAKAMHVGFRDRMEWFGDPDLADVPIQKLIDKEYAASLRRQIDQGGELAGQQSSEHRRMPPSETTHLTCADDEGNVAAITHSSGVSSGVVTPGLGFQHNSNMVMFDPVPGRRNSIAPWKRPVTGGGPVFFTRGGEFFLSIGSPAGSRKVTAIVQGLLNMLDFGMPLERAVSVDRIHAEDEPMKIVVEPHFDREAIIGLAARGFDVELSWYTARLVAVAKGRDGTLHGAADSRSDGGLVRVDESDAEARVERL